MRAASYLILSTLKPDLINGIGNGYVQALISNGATFLDYERYPELGLRGFENLLHSTIEKNNIKVLIYQADAVDFRFSLNFWKNLKDRVFRVMLVGDPDHYFESRDVYYGQVMDLVAVYDYSHRFRFQQFGIPAISFYSSYYLADRHRIPSLEKIHDVSFIGNVTTYPMRLENVEFLRKNGIATKIYGSGSKHGPVSSQSMTQIYNQTKINLNFTAVADRNNLSGRPKIYRRLRQLKGRMVEIALCGGFVLTDDAPGLEEMFEIGREIEVFHSREELLEKTRFYLKENQVREKIAERGRLRAMRDYELSSAMPKLIDQIESIRLSPEPRQELEIYEDPGFVTFFASYRFNIIARCIQFRNWGGAWEELKTVARIRKLDFRLSLKHVLDVLFPRLKKSLLMFRNAVTRRRRRGESIQYVC